MTCIKVEYVDSMGSDLSVVNAARVSFAKDASNYTAEQNAKLINFLAREKHELPFAHTAITLRCSAPVPQRTHCFKSKVGFVENEESRRYISDRPELFVPEFREAVKDKKQGSGGVHPTNEAWQTVYNVRCRAAIRDYLDMIADNV
jgi:thymidylate synthase (FAD)